MAMARFVHQPLETLVTCVRSSCLRYGVEDALHSPGNDAWLVHIPAHGVGLS